MVHDQTASSVQLPSPSGPTSGIPPSFPLQQVSSTLDYDNAEIGDHQYVLPLRAVMRMREGRALFKNEVEFRLYRKFSADAKISFDAPTPDALPEDQTKEQPAQPKGRPPK